MLGTLATLLLLAAAGCGLVAQNLLMSRIAGGGAILPALLANSAVGLALIVAAGSGWYGSAFIADTAARFRSWWILPGVLGTLFVFASVAGYRQLGAAATSAVLIAVQLAAALMADALGLGPALRPVGLTQWLGAALLVLGATLVLRK